VAWTSTSPEFTGEGDDFDEDVFVRDLLTGPAGAPAPGPIRAVPQPFPDLGFEPPSLSRDGALLAFAAGPLGGASLPGARPAPARPSAAAAPAPGPQLLTPSFDSQVYVAAYPASVPASLPAHDYGPVVVSQPGPTHTFVLTNTGFGPLLVTGQTIAGSHPADFTVVDGDCVGNTLHQEESCSVQVQFGPTAPGARSGSLVIDHVNGTTPQTTAALTGEGASPTFDLDPASVDFGDIPPNTTSPPRGVTITNTSSVEWPVGGFEISGQHPDQFTAVGTTCAQPLGPGASCTVTLTFTPDGLGQQSAALIGSFSSEEITVPLAGTGAKPVAPFRITHNGVETNKLNFGGVTVGVTSPPKTAVIENLSSSDGYLIGPLNVGGPRGANFTITQNGCTGTLLPPGGACPFQVLFQPTAAGARTGEVNGVVGPSPFVLGLTGTGLTASLAVTPSPLTWGDIPVGTSSSILFLTVRNTGTGPVVVSSVDVTTGFPEYVIIANTCENATLAPGGTCQVDLVFAPQALGDRTGEVTITSSAGPTKAALGGKGVPAPPLNRHRRSQPGGLRFGGRGRGGAGAGRDPSPSRARWSPPTGGSPSPATTPATPRHQPGVHGGAAWRLAVRGPARVQAHGGGRAERDPVGHVRAGPDAVHCRAQGRRGRARAVGRAQPGGVRLGSARGRLRRVHRHRRQQGRR